MFMFVGLMPHLLNYSDIAMDFSYALKSFFVESCPALLLSKAISNGILKTDPEQKNFGSSEIQGFNSGVLFLALFSVACKLPSFIFMFAVTKTVLDLYIFNHFFLVHVAGSMEHLS